MSGSPVIGPPVDAPTIERLWHTLTFQGGHNTSVVLVGTLLLGIAAGVVGSFAMLRRRALMADALSHATLPGICIAFLIAAALGADGRSLAVLLPGAAATGVLGLLAVHWATRATRLTEDAAIGAVLSTFFGAGVVLLSAIQGLSSGNQGGLKGFIFGQTATMHASDAMLMGAVACVSIVIAFACFKQLGLVSFNDEFASTVGVPVRLVDLVLMALVVMVTVAGLVAVGMVLVVALLIIPPVAARLWTDRLGRMVALASVFGGGAAFAGTAISAQFERVPTGPAIVLTAGAVFVVGMLAAPRRGIVAGMVRNLRFRARVHSDHALGSLMQSVSNPRPAGAVFPPGLTGALVSMRLVRKGHIRRENGMVVLTEAGIAAAALMERRRRLWERYLITHADIAPSHVDISADAVEHVIDPVIVARLEAELAAQDAAVDGGGGARD